MHALLYVEILAFGILGLVVLCYWDQKNFSSSDTLQQL